MADGLILIDSSVLVAYSREMDTDHGRAVTLIDKIGRGTYGEAVITDYIFDETTTAVLNKSKSLQRAIEIGNELKHTMKILETGGTAFELAWQLFRDQKNTRLSFTDCTIASIAYLQKIANIAAFDGEFKKIDGVTVVDS